MPEEIKDCAIIICSRLDSKRLPKKPFQKVGGVGVLQNLLQRLVNNFKTIIAVPFKDYDYYKENLNYTRNDNLEILTGSEHDPLDRMYKVARVLKLKTIIRVTHDKVLVDPELIKIVLHAHSASKSDYTYLTGKTSGIGFEIISFNCLRKAWQLAQGKPMEHLSYILRRASEKTKKYYMPKAYESNVRLLIDYPEDIQLLDSLFSILGSNVSPIRAIEYVNKYEHLLGNINKLPKVTVYTCAYNSEKFVDECISSVFKQTFPDYEYIFIDDCSNDQTYQKAILKISKLKLNNKHINVKWIKNDKNIGLSACSSKALSLARGKYITRLDVDDYYSDIFSLERLVKKIEENNVEAVYSSCLKVGYDTHEIQNPKDVHHVGGAIFETKSLNFLKFNDKLRNYEGLDIYKKAKQNLKIDYLVGIPIFHYRQGDNTMSKTNLNKREIVKQAIEKYYGSQ